MLDLENKDLLKVMWLPGEDEVLFRIKDETPVSLKSEMYSHISDHIDITFWKNLYSVAYGNWLDKDDNVIYDINYVVNQMMISALTNVNALLKTTIIFYWFDVDRTNDDDFKWEFCPMSRKRLKYLGDNYPQINSLVSPDYPLVFPGSVSV